MRRSIRFGLIGVLSTALVVTPLVAFGAAGAPSPGASGVGDPYYPLDGNGGYDVGHYDLDVTYNPATDRLVGTAAIKSKATQTLSAFDLDLLGLKVRSITVGGKAATWTRKGQELKIKPKSALPRGAVFTTVVKYDGVPKLIVDPSLGSNGFTATEDGAFVAGQPHGAASWFPVNDHPIDKASYTIHVTAPKALQVLSNGVPKGSTVKGDWRTTTWDATDKMASYLSTIAIGNYTTTDYTQAGRSYHDGIATSLFTPFAQPETGTQYAYSQNSVSAYKRLSHVITVPAGGADLAFDINRSTEEGYDYAFVEAHTVGSDDWTTLPDKNGHTTQDIGSSCTYGLSTIHPFIEHYQTANADGETCTPKGTTGEWNAATGNSGKYEKWDVDLSAYAGSKVEVSITYITDDVVLYNGVAIDNVVSSTGEGTTGFEADGNPLDGWTVPGAPAGSPGNTDDWVASDASVIVTTGEVAQSVLKREPEILDFLSKNFGPYPWKTSGGIVTNAQNMGFALETQTRPIYAPAFFDGIAGGSSVVAHELTHQWYGDSLAVKQWKNIWLNEGFATYAEWLWSEHEGLGTAQDNFDAVASFPASDPFWKLKIGDPGPDTLFDGAVYYRGAATLHALRDRIGDKPFFTLLKTWAAKNAGGNVEIPQFIAMAEKISGKRLGSFFKIWLYTGSKPAGIEPPAAERSASAVVAGAAGAASTSHTVEVMRRLAARG